MSERILLHICCAPCATAVVEILRAEGFDPHGIFYNPSIHPWKELQRRLEALKVWAADVDLPVEYVEEYPLEDNMSMLLNSDNRCLACFRDRMARSAAEASRLGIEKFTTTLSVSPYQNAVLIKKAGDEAGQSAGVHYMHRDFRESYGRSMEMSRKAGIYRQPYCGCIFSERDRYRKKKSPEYK